MSEQTECPICEDTGIDDRLANYRACGHCRKGKVLRLNYLRIKAAEMQQEVYSAQREIQHLEQTIPVIKREAQYG